MSTIKGYITELEQINEEVKRNNGRNKTLRKRVKELEDNIDDYLQSKDQEGMKYNGQAIVVERKEHRAPKKKKEKLSSVLSVLEEAGVNDPKNVYEKMMSAQKRSPVERRKIKFKKLPKF
jgi:predicted nuclease with TOPRIM domain